VEVVAGEGYGKRQPQDSVSRTDASPDVNVNGPLAGTHEGRAACLQNSLSQLFGSRAHHLVEERAGILGPFEPQAHATRLQIVLAPAEHRDLKLARG